MSEKNSSKYQAIKKIIMAPADPAQAEAQLEEALADAMTALDISAAAITIPGNRGGNNINIRQGEAVLLKALESLEKRMINSLRNEFGLEHLYSTLDYQGQKSLFSYVIKAGGHDLGIISGICAGNRNIALEHEFIEVLATALRHLLGQSRLIEKARIDAVRETSVTLNHEINNPLTAVLGNVQLILMKSKNLPEDVRKRLELIEESGLRIRDAVSLLMKATNAKSTDYIDDTSMIDLGDADQEKE
ncbi:MAG: hypothetical protein KAT58_00505 [candidate division Zixibacteria bacterium]|nr:hypothetical protein [candidate division Zixibacteria bacterium]